IMAGNLTNINASTANASAVRTKIMANGCDTFVSANGILKNAFDYNNPDFMPAAGSPALSGSSFTSASRISNPFFSQTPFRGALGGNPDSNWTDCWSRFNPQSESYESAPLNYPGALAEFSAATPVGRSVTFSNNSSFGNKFFWDFGVSSSNTDTSVEANPTFIFPANGTFQVTLTVKSPCGSSSLTKPVVINDLSSKPVANFSYVQSSTTGSREFTFTNLTDEKGFTTSYTWDFGVTSSATDTTSTKDPVFTFPASGSYQVRLIANGQFGSDTLIKTLLVSPTAVTEIESKLNDVVVYPNPAENQLFVAFELSQKEMITVTLFDISGRLVFAEEATAYQAGKTILPIAIQALNNGMYFLNLSGNDIHKTTRVVISR
ncbi:MAG: PKD domain-containing protein, partial [Bacteroidia bacterium]